MSDKSEPKYSVYLDPDNPGWIGLTFTEDGMFKVPKGNSNPWTALTRAIEKVVRAVPGKLKGGAVLEIKEAKSDSPVDFIVIAGVQR